MIVYHASKQGFLKDVFNGTIADEIDHAFVTHLGRHTSPNEVQSWKNSMMHMYKVINTPNIPDSSNIAIEYQIPLTSKRIDFIIAGLDENKKENTRNVTGSGAVLQRAAFFCICRRDFQ